MAKRKTAKRALPESFRQKSTKGSGTKKTTTKKSGYSGHKVGVGAVAKVFNSGMNK